MTRAQLEVNIASFKISIKHIHKNLTKFALKRRTNHIKQKKLYSTPKQLNKIKCKLSQTMSCKSYEKQAKVALCLASYNFTHMTLLVNSAARLWPDVRDWPDHWHPTASQTPCDMGARAWVPRL